jgi:hypothetical protein
MGVSHAVSHPSISSPASHPAMTNTTNTMASRTACGAKRDANTLTIITGRSAQSRSANAGLIRLMQI